MTPTDGDTFDLPVLTLPGLWNSGPQHWQTHWERKHPDWRRVAHRDWETPDRTEWVAELDAAIAACARPPVLAAHSLACALVAHWAASGSVRPIAGAFLVAPSDVEAPSYPSGTTGFVPMPMRQLPFPSLVVTSTDDVYISLPRAREFARAWGSELLEIGAAGHINGASGFGPWPQGDSMLRAFCRRCAAAA